MFRIVEDAILITIAILTESAVIFEIILFSDNQKIITNTMINRKKL